MLCTLGMLSSNALRMQGAFRKAPLHTVVVDEASQIEIGDYIPLFSSFTTIRKVIFIGDNMQCRFFPFCICTGSTLSYYLVPPHGQDDIQELQSVFEVENLVTPDSNGRTPFIFLNTQCKFLEKSCWLVIDLVLDRMPPQIGDFIARTVYSTEEEDSGPLLKSSDSHPLAYATSTHLCCHFVNVPGQQVSHGTSWKVCALLMLHLLLVHSSF